MSVPSHVQLFVTHGLYALQAHLSMNFSRQEHWSRLSYPTLDDLLDSEMEHVSLTSHALIGRLFIAEPPGKPIMRADKCISLLGLP